MSRLPPPPRFLRITPWLAVALLLATCGRQAQPGPSRAELDRVWSGTDGLVEVQVHELHCTACEDSTRQALGALPGVASVEADHETDRVRVHLDPGVDRYAVIPGIREALHGIGKDVVGEDEIPTTP